jgi:hypothetical protein
MSKNIIFVPFIILNKRMFHVLSQVNYNMPINSVMN